MLTYAKYFFLRLLYNANGIPTCRLMMLNCNNISEIAIIFDGCRIGVEDRLSQNGSGKIDHKSILHCDSNLCKFHIYL